MKKIIRIAAGVVCVLTLSACGQSKLAKQAEIQGQLSLAAKDYETAKNTLKISIDDGSPTDEAVETYNIIDGYLRAKSALDKSDYEAAQKILDQIPDSYANLAIAEDIDSLKSEIDEGTADADSTSAKITRAAKLLITQQYNEAYALLNSIDMRFITDDEADKVTRLKTAAKSATEQTAASQALGIAKAEAEAAGGR